jgi:two-component sensor histidine kinase
MTVQPLNLRQLRHHTRNTLQRVLIEIHGFAARTDASRGRRLLEQVENRIMLSVEISDALFGITREPAAFPERFRTLCRSLLALFADAAQHLRLDIALEGTCPPELEMAALCATNELVGNAVKHGMHMRLIGQISVSLTCSAENVELVVIDDGWGAATAPKPGQGLGIARDLAKQFHGTLSVGRNDGNTVATIMFRTTVPDNEMSPPRNTLDR